MSRVFTEEHRQKLSVAAKNRVRKPHSPETRKQISTTRKKRIAEGKIKVKNQFTSECIKKAAIHRRKNAMRMICRGVIYENAHAVAKANNVCIQAVYTQLALYGDINCLGAKNNPNFWSEMNKFLDNGGRIEPVRLENLKYRAGKQVSA